MSGGRHSAPSRPDPEFIPVESAEAREVVAGLARKIWYEHYVPIIGTAQVDYMVSGFQSTTAIAGQIERGQRYYLVHVAGQAVGYFAIESQAAARRMFLSKFYLLEAARGRGIGHDGLGFIEARCRGESLDVLWLTVNKFNPAVHFYERQGFARTADIVTDIGGGFVMDDYRMEKGVPDSPITTKGSDR